VVGMMLAMFLFTSMLKREAVCTCDETRWTGQMMSGSEPAATQHLPR
jgi:hypothetical protein